MKKVLLLALFGLSFIPAQGQNYPTISDNEDAVWVSEAVKFAVGTDINVGTGQPMMVVSNI